MLPDPTAVGEMAYQAQESLFMAFCSGPQTIIIGVVAIFVFMAIYNSQPPKKK